MSVDPTVLQNAAELRRAQERSLQRTRPPTQVPGYEPERFLGSGAYGEVWVAMDRNTGRRVAIKFYTHRGGLDWSLLSREVEKLTFLFADRYVVQLIDVGWESDPPYYIMEYLERGSLADRLAAGPLPAAEAVELFREVAVGLVHAHDKGVLHCDLKPANVLLDQDGKPRLADFGQSRLSHEQTPSLGTLFYMAPEQADLKAAPDAHWDVYALGALLYCMLTGSPPYRNEPGAAEVHEAEGLEAQLARYRELLQRSRPARGHRRVPGVDRDLAEIIERCLAIDPRKRFANPQAVLNALASRSARKARRPLLVLGAIGPAVLLCVVSLFGANAVNMTLRQNSQSLGMRALESNRFAAQFVAETVANAIDRRWLTLEREAAQPALQRALADATDKPRSSPERRRLQEMLEDMGRRHGELGASSWVIMDGRGVQLARSPLREVTIDKNYSYRDYFHGRGQNLRAGTPDLTPLKQPHLSTVFVSTSSNERKVAFSVPIVGAANRTQKGRVAGVLAITVVLGDFAELKSEGGSDDRLAVLVDAKPDWQGKKGAVLEHKQMQDVLRHSTGDMQFYLASDQIERLERLRSASRRADAADARARPPDEMALLFDYRDPVGGDFEGRWLAAIEPVVVSDRPHPMRDTGWAVIVQERYSVAVAPVVQLGESLARRGLLALGVVLAIVTAMWGFVMVAIDEFPRFRLIARWRKNAGLAPTAGAGSFTGSASSLGSSDPSNPAKETSDGE